MNQLVVFTDHALALIATVGERASYRFFEFFTAQIRNPNTRRAYVRCQGQIPCLMRGEWAANDRCHTA